MLAVLGERVAKARRGRAWTQADLAAKLGVTQARLSQIEAGRGDGVPAHLWFAAADALGIPLRFEFGRDPVQQLEDSGHLELQEFVLELGRLTRRARGFELQIRPSPGLSVDVGLRDDELRFLLLIECWNTFGNLGASVRSTRRKLVELEDMAVAVGGEVGPYRVAACWVVRDAPRNRAVVERYPEIFNSTFVKSQAWRRCLFPGHVLAPGQLGFVWCDPRAKRLADLRG